MAEYLIFLYFLIFVLGLFVGSFLNVVSDRVVNGISFVKGRSFCEFCKSPLSAIELIPLLSFLVQKGKCRSCKEKISLQYPFSELLTGVVFVLLAVWMQIFLRTDINSWILFFYYIVLSSFLLVMFFSDLKYMIIPDNVVFTAISFSLMFLILSTLMYLLDLYFSLNSYTFGKYLLKAGYLNNYIIQSVWFLVTTVGSAFLISLFFYFLVFITKGRGMGGGDVKLGFLLGLFTPFPLSFITVFLAFLFGALLSLVLVVFRRKTMKDSLPFGPFLIASSYVALFFGNQIIDMYLKLL